MRNLLGRLNARSPDELARIASFWGVQLASGPGGRHRQVGQLYRALTDSRSVRDVWDQLSADERALVRLLALGDADDETALILTDIATALAISETDARRTATALFHAGIVVREGDDAELPPGTAPRLFLPRELAQLFRRVQDEIEAGDLSGTPLRALLELLDDAELEEAAKVWGLNVIPGLRRREDLTRQILHQIAADRVEAVAAKQRADARKIWQRLRAEPAAALVSLADATTASGLDPHTIRDARRLRDALAELETALLVWHTYRPDGSRWLFIPPEIRQPRIAPRLESPLPEPLSGDGAESGPWRHPAALAWDLLTLLREITNDPPRLGERPHHSSAFPRPWLRHVNRLLWRSGDDRPPPGYLELLLALAEGEGLVRLAEESGQSAFALTPAIRAWRDRTFADQMARLRERWIGLAEWMEGRDRDAVVVWGADWRGFRRRLVGLIEELPTEGWYPIEGVAAWAAGRDADLLGATFTAAVARQSEERADGPDQRRRAAVAEVVAVEMETAPVWFGLVQVATLAGHGKAMRRTPVARSADVVDNATKRAESLAIDSDGEIRLIRPSPVLVWSISAFAEHVRLGRECRYQLSSEGLRRALAAGFDLDQVIGFLNRQSGGVLPPEVAGQLQGWTRGYGRVRLSRAAIVRPDDPANVSALIDLMAGAGLVAQPIGTESILVELSGNEGSAADEQKLIALLRAHGHTPHWISESR